MLIMYASEVPWIDEAGYWRKRLFVGNGADDYIDLAVGARLKTDGSLKFKPMITPSAVVPDATSALRSTANMTPLQGPSRFATKWLRRRKWSL
jgi:hypothetical protein